MNGVSIKPSAAGEIQTLVAALSSADQIRRESAIARLAIIGERAVERLAAVYPAADRDTRIAILRVAEAIADPRVLPLGVEALAAGGDEAIAGASMLRALLDSPVDRTASQALDALVGAALSPHADRPVRVAAFDALRDMPATVLDPVADALQRDPDAGLQARVADAPREAATVDAVWQDALEGTLADDPGRLRDAVKARAHAAPFIALQKLVEAVRLRETAAGTPARQEAWRQVRGAIHQALALRGSRVAVYDLRETVERAQAPLPTAFMAALHVVGDESCLEPIAAAWTASADPAWHHQLEAALHAIMARDRITRRGAAWKRLQARYPDVAAVLNTTSRTTPRPTRSPRT
jgi:hypothetical protein